MTTQKQGIAGIDWPKWLSLYAAASFLMLGIDAGINHLAGGRESAIAEYSLPLTPLIFAPLAVILCLTAFASPRWRPLLAWWVGSLGVIVGGTGFFLHVAADLEDFASRSLLGKFGPDAFPPFAPAAFAATGALVLLIGLDAWLRARKRQDEAG